jgi:hypothetical protein
VLASCCRSAQQLLEGLRQAACSVDSLAQQAAAALASTGLEAPEQRQVVAQVWRAAQGWQDLAAGLCRGLRARLPEPSLLVGLLGQLATGAEQGVVGTPAVDADACTGQEKAGAQQEQSLQLLLVVLGGYVSLGGGEGAGLDPVKHLVTQVRGRETP